MNLRKFIKRDTKIIILSVILLTIITMNVSYSYVFSVKSYTTGDSLQQFSTGELNVTVSKTGITQKTLLPTSTSSLPTSKSSSATGSVGTNYAKVTITNPTGKLDAEYGITISPDTSSLPSGKNASDIVNLQYINIGIYNETTGETGWVQFGSKYYTSISNLTSSSTNTYAIFRGKIANGKTNTLRIYIWLSDTTPVSEIGKLAYFKVDVRSTTQNGQLNNNGLVTP